VHDLVAINRVLDVIDENRARYHEAVAQARR
jgi:hypothetical protein